MHYANFYLINLHTNDMLVFYSRYNVHFTAIANSGHSYSQRQVNLLLLTLIISSL